MAKSDSDFIAEAASVIVDEPAPSDTEARQELAAAGIDADQLGRSLQARLARRTWQAVAKRNEQAARDRSMRKPRPSKMTRETLLPLVMNHPRRVNTTMNFRNADELSADDLWRVYCDLESLNELD